jgi:transcriptional regulator with XRE-family HTH domain
MAIFEEYKNKHGGLTQAELADDLGFSTQSSVSQYLKGKIPLNLDVAIKFAKRFECPVSDFSPSIQAEIDRIAVFASEKLGKAFDTETRVDSRSSSWATYESAKPETRAVVDAILCVGTPPPWFDRTAVDLIQALKARAKERISERKKDSGTAHSPADLV